MSTTARGWPRGLPTEAERAGIRILVAEDEATLLQTCVQILRMHGYDVTPASDGEEALDLIRAREFDIMLLDLYLKGVPGIDLLAAALERRPDTLVIPMTGNPTLESSFAALDAGAWDYLPKPFSSPHIELLIGRAARTVLQQRAASTRDEPSAPPAT
jgi:DNA-binding NtrC family response regulator